MAKEESGSSVSLTSAVTKVTTGVRLVVVVVEVESVIFPVFMPNVELMMTEAGTDVTPPARNVDNIEYIIRYSISTDKYNTIHMLPYGTGLLGIHFKLHIMFYALYTSFCTFGSAAIRYTYVHC